MSGKQQSYTILQLFPWHQHLWRFPLTANWIIPYPSEKLDKPASRKIEKEGLNNQPGKVMPNKWDNLLGT